MSGAVPDPVFDSFLEECLTGIRPPDLSHRILARFAAENSHKAQADESPDAEVVIQSIPLHRWQRELPPGLDDDLDEEFIPGKSSYIVPPPVQLEDPSLSTHSQHLRIVAGDGSYDPSLRSVDRVTAMAQFSDRQLKVYRYWALSLASAASLLVAFSAWSVWYNRPQVFTGNLAGVAALGTNSAETNTGSSVAPVVPNSAGTGDSRLVGQSSIPVVDAVPLNGKAFDLDAGLRSLPSMGADANLATSGLASQAIAQLDDASVVALIDQQMSLMWNRLGVQVAGEVDLATWNRRIGQNLLGRSSADDLVAASNNANSADTGPNNAAAVGNSLGDANIAPIASNTNRSNAMDRAAKSISQQRLDMMVGLVRQPDFAKTWAQLLSAKWLGTVDPKNIGVERQRFEAWLSSAIARGIPYNEIAAQLVGASGSDWPEAADFQPASHFMIKQASGEPHQAVASIAHSLLDLDLACARCHDAGGTVSGATLVGGIEKSSNMTARQQYWSLVAMLMPLQWETFEADGKSHRRVLDRDLVGSGSANSRGSTVFYELADGRMQSARPAFPDGRPLAVADGVDGRTLAGSQRQALAGWIRTDRSLARAAVQTAWQMMLGEPLIPRLGADANVGLGERAELLEALTDQFQAHHYDLRKLAAWVGSSRLFALKSKSITAAEELLADPDLVQKWGVQQATFAVFRDVETRTVSANVALRETIRWKSESRGIDRTLLAQPSITPESQGDKNQANRPKESDLAKPLSALRQQLWLETVVTSQTETELIDRLAKSKLTWAEQVEHIYAVFFSLRPGDSVRKLADELLSTNDGDRRQAMQQFIWACRASIAS